MRRGGDVDTRTLLQKFQETPEFIIALSEAEKQVNKQNCLQFAVTYDGEYWKFKDRLYFPPSELMYLKTQKIEEYRPYVRLVRKEAKDLLQTYYEKNADDAHFETEDFIDMFANCVASKKTL